MEPYCKVLQLTLCHKCLKFNLTHIEANKNTEKVLL